MILVGSNPMQWTLALRTDPTEDATSCVKCGTSFRTYYDNGFKQKVSTVSWQLATTVLVRCLVTLFWHSYPLNPIVIRIDISFTINSISFFSLCRHLAPQNKR